MNTASELDFTFHGFCSLDELGDGASHSLGISSQLLLQLVTRLLQDLGRERTVSRGRLCPQRERAPGDMAGNIWGYSIQDLSQT